MEERKTIFDYVGMVFSTFGFSIVILNVFCLLFGEDAREFSRIFSMGREGLSTAAMMQFLTMSVLIIFIRALFFTDIVIKSMPVIIRIFCMLLSVIGIVVCFILHFDWFPADQWLPWVMFIVSFGICFVVSALVAILRERIENKRMEAALAKLKQQSK